MSPRIPFQRPEMPHDESILRYFDKSRGERYFSNGGPCSEMLGNRLEEYLGVSHVVLFNNATSALLLGSRAAFGSPRAGKNYVITPSFTFAATSAALVWAGFEPYFVDIDPHTLQVSCDRVEEAIALLGDRAAGALLTSTFGVAPAESVSSSWKASCDRAGLALLIDSAAGFGSRFANGVRIGGQGSAEVFSFHSTKPFAIGEGGAVATNDPELADQLKTLINFGFNERRVVKDIIGLNGKLPEILCAVGLALLDDFDSILQRRQRLVSIMRSRLSAFSEIQVGLEQSAVQFVPITVAPKYRNLLLETLDHKGVQARTYFDPALHQMAGFESYLRGPLPSTNLVSSSVLSLPMWNDIPESTIEEICAIICQFESVNA